MFGQIPIVENEIKKETGEVKPEDEVNVAPVQKLVTEMGTYVTQSALSSSRPSKKEEDRYKTSLPVIFCWLDGISLLSVTTGSVVPDPHSEVSCWMETFMLQHPWPPQ